MLCWNMPVGDIESGGVEEEVKGDVVVIHFSHGEQGPCVAIYCFLRNVGHWRHRVEWNNHIISIFTRNRFTCLLIGGPQSHALGCKHYLINYRTHRF